jgi:hypothetical protein
VNDEVKSTRKEAVVTYFKDLVVGLKELSKASFRLYVSESKTTLLQSKTTDTSSFRM